MPRFGVSGSTVLSASERLGELFWEGIDHIEIGSMACAAVFRRGGADRDAAGVGAHAAYYSRPGLCPGGF